MKDWLILVDSREQYPFIFPNHLVVGLPDGSTETHRLHTKVCTLKTGDYALAGHETARLIERKGSMQEIMENLSPADRPRFLRAIDRLAEECRLPTLVLEGTLTSLNTPIARIPEPGLLLDDLMRVLDDRGITLETHPCTTLNQRRALGEWVARKLISGAQTNGCTSTRFGKSSTERGGNPRPAGGGVNPAVDSDAGGPREQGLCPPA